MRLAALIRKIHYQFRAWINPSYRGVKSFEGVKKGFTIPKILRPFYRYGAYLQINREILRQAAFQIIVKDDRINEIFRYLQKEVLKGEEEILYSTNRPPNINYQTVIFSLTDDERVNLPPPKKKKKQKSFVLNFKTFA